MKGRLVGNKDAVNPTTLMLKLIGVDVDRLISQFDGGETGIPTNYTDEDGNKLYVGDVVRLTERADPTHTELVFVADNEDNKGHPFVDSIFNACDPDSGEIDSEYKVELYTDSPDVKDGETHGNYKFVADAAPTEEAPQDETPKKKKHGYLYYEGCPTLHCGTVGRKTPYKDVNGKTLVVGDIVALWNQNMPGFDRYPMAVQVVRSDAIGPFVMGIQIGCNPETGEIGDGWKVRKLKRYTELVDGETTDGIVYRSPKVEDEDDG